jgi:hypothetical protein
VKLIETGWSGVLQCRDKVTRKHSFERIIMNFLDMKSHLKPKKYEWYRTVMGGCSIWQKEVLNGEILLRIEGAKEAGGYWGSIRSMLDIYGNLEEIFSTWPAEGIHVPFATPENCALHLDQKWKEIINAEQRKLT